VSEKARRVAVVSGAARGIGRALAEGLAAAGSPVAAVDLREPDETVAAITEAGGVCRGFVADVSDEAAVLALREAVHEALGPCAILVNNAAELHSAPFADLDYATWRRVIRTNLDSQFLMARAFLPDMAAAGWGRIVNVASSSLFTTTPGIAAYMASKGGVIGLTSALANDVGDLGVTVNAVSPGLTRTPGVEADIAAGVLPADAPEHVIEQQAIRRAGVPGDLVGAVRFLASDASSFMTGQLLVVDGGMTRR
jgi:NAD(P)-dependent dehydrogenase (short-subunit alcohol dehydrogenase family)